MAYTQKVSTWMQDYTQTRRMSVLFDTGMDIDINTENVSFNKQGITRGGPIPPSSSIITLTTNNNRGKITPVAVRFFNAHPELMDPQNILQLITRYSSKEILGWANQDLPDPILNEHQLREISSAAISNVARHIDNGEEIRRNTLEFIRRHNRLHCWHSTLSRLQQRRKGTTLVSMDIDLWYECLTSDDTASTSKGSDDTPSLGSILGELLHDPLFTYRSLEEVPNLILLELCISHSYEHVSDKIKLNNPSAQVSPQAIVKRIEKAL